MVVLQRNLWKLRWSAEDNIIESYYVCRFSNILNYLLKRN